MPAPPTRPVLRERYDRRRQQVIDAAARLFAEQGYQATSIEDLSIATGLAAGGLYHYVDGKEQLLVEICDGLLEPLLVEAHTIVEEGGQPAEVLRALVQAWVLHVVGHRDHMLVFQQERHRLENDQRWKAVRAQRRSFERILDGILADGELTGAFMFSDRRLAVLALLAMVNYLPQWYRPHGRLTATEIADSFCDILLSGAKQPSAPISSAHDDS